MLVVNRRIRIPLREFSFRFARSGGPGGQRLNKASTKATLRWDVLRSPSLPEDLRERLLARFRRRIIREGELLLSSQRFRDQGRNVADCLEKLRAMIGEVSTPPIKRKFTKPTKASRERRLKEKQGQAKKKRLREKVREGE
jgi:ribosome-associated protein